MQEIIASVDHIKFDLEIAVEQQLGAQPLPFPGMDKSGAAVCEFFLKAACGKGGMCPFRHISGEKTVVCKHWLRGLCKKGDQCEFLHEYDMTKMPECYFYSKFGKAQGTLSVCLLPAFQLQIRNPGSACHPQLALQCFSAAHSPEVGHRGSPSSCWSCGSSPALFFPVPIGSLRARVFHSKTVLCNSFQQSNNPPLQRSSSLIQLTSQNSSPNQQRAPQVIGVMQSQNSSAGNRGPRPLEQVTCYKCGEKGHYANRCTKGHLAFLSGQ
ncbi:PREDICTED: cleavage and polyadenylation specificity factor subunit 4 [Galeopterus variegatus]|uniref:Cleavage and polyadenylation specificity factor subunit 4 n=1 Tax=Galeopterus variegatus TaxID=482537 RepID=A0ABM0RVR6_GALVR|nr:PREDICTED: cleavage and polyadenylation specificity factor subunit 4 [Galeopterus variegatus]